MAFNLRGRYYVMLIPVRRNYLNSSHISDKDRVNVSAYVEGALGCKYSTAFQILTWLLVKYPWDCLFLCNHADIGSGCRGTKYRGRNSIKTYSAIAGESDWVLGGTTVWHPKLEDWWWCYLCIQLVPRTCCRDINVALPVLRGRKM